MPPKGENPNPENLRRFLGYARPYRWLLVGAVCAGVIRFSLQFVTPWGVGVLLDGALKSAGLLPGVTRQARFAQVHEIAALMAIALLVRCVAQFTESILTNRLGNRMVFDLRRRLYTHIHHLSLSFFDQRQVGSIGSRVLNDISVAQNLIGSGVTSVVIDAIALLFTFAVLFKLEWRLTLVAFVIMPGYVVTLRKLNPRIRATSQEIQEKFSQISGTVYESLAGMQVVQAFTQERAAERQFVRETRQHYERLMTRARLNATLNFLTTFLTGMGTILLLWWGGQMVIRGMLTPGMLVQFYSYVGYLYGPLSRFAELNQVYQNSMGAVDRVFEILDTEPDVAERPAEERPALPAGAPFTGHVRFDGVSFGYDPTRPVLREVDLDVAPGKMVALVGPSGSGKTTITRLLLRFYDVTAGTIWLDGHDLRDLPLKELRQQVGVVLQEPILFTGSVRENIRFGNPAASEEEVVAAAKAANAHDFIDELQQGYDTLVGERGAHLSGGQRQRISIARALLKDPRLLILDEATSALDSESERLIQEALVRLMEGRTSFVVAHRLSTIINADQIVVLDRGRIVEQGTHEELLLANGLYAELCAKQFIGQETEGGGDWFETVLVRDVMSPDVGMVAEDMPVEEVAGLVQETHHHGFPVGNDDGELVGIVTISDVEEALLEGRGDATVGEICTRNPLLCHPEETLGEALRQLGARDVGRLPVVDPHNLRRLVGMLRRSDVVTAYSRFAELQAEERAARALGPVAGDPLGGLRFAEVRLAPGSPAVGRAVRDLELPQECILVSIRRAEGALVPRGDTVLEAGDRIFALGHPECAAALRETMAEVALAAG